MRDDNYGLKNFGDVQIGEQSYWFSDIRDLPKALLNGDYDIKHPEKIDKKS